MTPEKIVRFAQKSIYDTVKYIGEWNGYNVYEPGWDDEEPRFIGFPQFILVKDNIIRWTEDDPGFRGALAQAEGESLDNSICIMQFELFDLHNSI